MVTMTLYVRQQKRHRCKEQNFGLCGRRQGWDLLKEVLVQQPLLLQTRWAGRVRTHFSGPPGGPCAQSRGSLTHLLPCWKMGAPARC